ncbi:MAG: hypothetical protein RIQ93_2682 [Verrucomicrobiota bacterium]|jgi:transcriptional regulator with XRE-family HTH domain
MQTIGERLEEARKKKGISIREAAEATKIRGDYLQKFESNQFDIGLTEIYIRGFLRNYANYLKLSGERIINDYAALGRGDVRPRQPNREVYGRMDISVATAGESSDRPAPPDTTAPQAEPARAQPRYPRGSGPKLPGGPDPATVFKYVKWGGMAAIALLALLMIKALFTGNSSPPSRTPAPGVANSVQLARAAALTYKLIATDPVQVRVVTRVSSGADSFADGEEIFNGTLMKGQSTTVPLNGTQTLYASAGQNLTLVWNGKTIPLGFSGAGSVPLDIPASAR